MMRILLIREGTGEWPCYVHVLVRLYALWPANCHPVCIVSEPDPQKIGKEGLANGNYGLFMILLCYVHRNSNLALKYHCQYPWSGLLEANELHQSSWMPELFAQLTLHKFKLEILSPTLFYGRRLQSCMGTWARLGYATFDAQLQKAYFVTTVYSIRTSVGA